MNRFTSERFNSGESPVNFSHLEKNHTFKKFCSGEYLSHLQKIQFFGRFDCGHLLNISHICKDSDIQKIPLPENTILSLGQNLNIIFPLHSTSRHFTSPPLCLPYFKPLCATSLHLPFCLPHLMTPSVIFASLQVTSHHFTSPILSASLHATSLRLLFFLHHFTSLCATSLCLYSLSLPHFTPLCVASRFFSLASPHFMPLQFASPFVHLHFTPLHATLCRLPFFSHSLHLISRHFTSPPVLSALIHFMPLCFASFYLPHFMPLHATSHYFHLTSRHFTLPPVLSASLHATSCHFTLPPIFSASLHATSLYFTSPPFFSPHFASPHLISSIRPLRFTGNASPKKYVNAQSSKHAHQPASQPFERFALANLLNICHICKRFGHSKDSNFFPNLLNVLNILLTSLFLQKIQIFERFNSRESLK